RFSRDWSSDVCSSDLVAECSTKLLTSQQRVDTHVKQALSYAKSLANQQTRADASTFVEPVESLTASVISQEKRLAAIVKFLQERKSTRLNSSHVKISYAVFCLKKKN